MHINWMKTLPECVLSHNTSWSKYAEKFAVILKTCKLLRIPWNCWIFYWFCHYKIPESFNNDHHHKAAIERSRHRSTGGKNHLTETTWGNRPKREPIKLTGWHRIVQLWTITHPQLHTIYSVDCDLSLDIHISEGFLSSQMVTKTRMTEVKSWESLGDLVHVEAWILPVFDSTSSVHDLLGEHEAIVLKSMLEQISREQQQTNTQNKYVHVCLQNRSLLLLQHLGFEKAHGIKTLSSYWKLLGLIQEATG